MGEVAVEFREEALTDSTSTDILQQRFGTLSDACLSLFMAISGGISWVEFTDPLISLHWTNGVIVFIFIFFTMFALLNIVTGVFVDGAISAGREDDEEIFQSFLDAERMNLKKLRQLSECISDNDDGYISREELEIHLAQPEVRLLFKTFGLGCHQARDLFKMLNVDGTGRVTIDEFMNYLTRMQDGLHLNVLTILYEHKRMGRKLRRFENDTWSGLEELTDRMSMLEKKLHKSGSRRKP